MLNNITAEWIDEVHYKSMDDLTEEEFRLYKPVGEAIGFFLMTEDFAKKIIRSFLFN